MSRCLVTLACASGRGRDLMLAYVLTLGARCVAPLDVIRVGDAISWPLEVWATTIVAVWIPAAFWMWQSSLARTSATSLSSRATRNTGRPAVTPNSAGRHGAPPRLTRPRGLRRRRSMRLVPRRRVINGPEHVVDGYVWQLLNGPEPVLPCMQVESPDAAR